MPGRIARSSLVALIADGCAGSAGTGTAKVFHFRSVDIRRNPFFTLTCIDFLDDAELTEGTEVMDVAVSEGVFLYFCCSRELSEAA